MYSCEKCKKLRNGVKRCSLYELPEVLCVHLKRFRLFEYGGGIGFSGKVSQYVQFPLDGLDLKRYLHAGKWTTVYVKVSRIMIFCWPPVFFLLLQRRLSQQGDHLSSPGCHSSYGLLHRWPLYCLHPPRWTVVCLWWLQSRSSSRRNSWRIGGLCAILSVSNLLRSLPVTQLENYYQCLERFHRKWSDEEDITKQEILREWTKKDITPEKDEKFHLLSRKWLTNFCWGEETGPIDNSDVVCPHGYFAPHDTVHMAGTWVPHSVWEILQKRWETANNPKFLTVNLPMIRKRVFK